MLQELRLTSRDIQEASALLVGAWKTIKGLSLGMEKEQRLYTHLNAAARDIKMATNLLDLTIRNVAQDKAPVAVAAVQEKELS